MSADYLMINKDFTSGLVDRRTVYIGKKLFDIPRILRGNLELLKFITQDLETARSA